MNTVYEDQEEEYQGKGQMVICPKCHREHFSPYELLDEFMDCECGFSFYAFAFKGLRIIMTPEEASYEPIARAMRRFIISTGRCTDIPPHLYMEPNGESEFEMTVQERDLDTDMESILEEYQMTVFGQCFLTRELLCSICESFEHGHDIELKKQKDHVDIIELKKKKVSDQSSRPRAKQMPYRGMISPARRPAIPHPGGILLENQDARCTRQ